MTRSTWSYVRAGAAALCFVAGTAVAQPTTKPAPAKPAAPAAKAPSPAAVMPAQPGKPDMKKPDAKTPGMPSPEDMKKMEEMMKPGAAQAEMAKAAGEWTYVMKMRMAPEAPWMESPGTSKMMMIMDGRYLHEETSGTMEMMGQKNEFKGLGIFGYNNLAKQYEGSWVDNMGTGVMYMTGKSTDGGKTVEWTGTSDDPMTGKKTTMRMIDHHVDADHATLEFFQPGPDGKEFKGMEIDYTRKGAKAESSKPMEKPMKAAEPAGKNPPKAPK